MNGHLIDYWVFVLESNLKFYDKLLSYKESVLNSLYNLDIDNLSKANCNQINLLEREINILQGFKMCVIHLKEECIKFSAALSDQLINLSCENDYLKRENKRLLEIIARLNFWKEQEDVIFELYVKRLKIEVPDDGSKTTY